MMRAYYLVVIFGIIFSCSSKTEIENFNRQRWIDDAGGCKNLRGSEIKNLLAHKSEILGLSENQIETLLGKPDERDLYVRTQKFMVYYAAPGRNCGDTTKSEQIPRLSIRISALGTANEIVFYP